jgi:demethylsterigmatocystin 6-O-methyltransferase
MDAIITQIQALARDTDEAGRLNIIQSLQRAKIDIQSPQDTFMELAVPVGDHILQLGVT